MDYPTTRLSPRQYEIVSLIAEGKDNKTIARQMGISMRTVQNQLTIAFRKINVESRTQAALWAIRQSPAPSRQSSVFAGD